jgi:CheY-like chemotaxis protein
MRKGTILFIDDELCPNQTGSAGNYMWYYVEALRDLGLEVKEVTDPDEGQLALAEPGARFGLVIIDIMMPPGKTLPREATLNGMRTGVVLAEAISKQCPSIPIVILTNRVFSDTKELSRIPTVKAILSKPDYTPFQLAEKATQILDH